VALAETKMGGARETFLAFVFSQTRELRVPEMIIARPFQELELSNEHSLQPLGPSTSECRSPIDTGVVDYVIPLSSIAATLVEIVRGVAPAHERYA
jgi:hypothetical protein